MRLKRSEYKTLKDIISCHTKQLKVINIDNQLEEYEMYCEFLFPNFIRVYDGNGDYISFLSLEEFDNWFAWYKQWIEDGDIFVECDWCVWEDLPSCCNCSRETTVDKQLTIKDIKKINAKKVLKSNQKK